MANRTLTRDMTFGRPSKHILAFALPLIFGNLFQQLYSMADSIIVGQYLGVDALAAVGSVGSLQFLILGFCMGSCAGLAIPIAQRFGAHDEENLRKYVANSVWLSAAMGLIVTAITVALARQILVWMQTPANIIDEAYAYFAAVLLGRCISCCCPPCSTSCWIWCSSSISTGDARVRHGQPSFRRASPACCA